MKRRKYGYILSGVISICLMMAFLSGCGKSEGAKGDDKGTVNSKVNGERLDNSKVSDLEMKLEDDTDIEESIYDRFGFEEREGFMYETTQVDEEHLGERIPIYTIDELKNIKNDGNYVLMNDLDASELTESLFETSVTGFTGNFDGNYHKILNLNVTLFEKLDGGRIERVGIEGTSADRSGLVATMRSGVIGNCYVTGQIGKNADRVERRGGLINTMEGSSCHITYCYNAADIFAGGEESASDYELGGIVGYIEYNEYTGEKFYDIYMEHCENYGSINGNVYRKIGGIGGIVGKIFVQMVNTDKNFSVDVNNCMNFGEISINYERASDKKDASIYDIYEGGIAGIIGAVCIDNRTDVEAKVYFNQCANYGSIYEEGSQAKSAGICGDLECQSRLHATRTDIKTKVTLRDCLNACNEMPASGSGMISQISHYNSELELIHCINLVDSSNPMYGNIEEVYETKNITNCEECYFLKYARYQNDEGSVGLTADEMKDKNSSFLKDVEGGVWKMENDKNNGYPYLDRDYVVYN